MNNQQVIENVKNVLAAEGKAILNMQKSINEDFIKILKTMLACKGRIVVCGVGKSGIVARKIAATLASTGTPSFFIHPADASHGDLGMIKKEDIFLALSCSGETDEVIRLLPFIKNNHNILVSITNKLNSSLAKRSDFHLHIDIAGEACPYNLAPTTSSTATLAMGDALAVGLIHLRDFKPENFARFHPAGRLGKQLTLTIEELIDRDVFWVDIEQGVSQLITSLSSGGKGLIPVLVNKTLVGVFCDGDLRRCLEVYGAQIFDKKISELMVKKPKKVQKTCLAIDVLQLMEDYNITAIPVMDNDILMGVVNIHDILKSGLS